MDLLRLNSGPSSADNSTDSVKTESGVYLLQRRRAPERVFRCSSAKVLVEKALPESRSSSFYSSVHPANLGDGDVALLPTLFSYVAVAAGLPGLAVTPRTHDAGSMSVHL